MFQKGDLVSYSWRNSNTYPYYLGIVLRMFKDNFTDVFLPRFCGTPVGFPRRSYEIWR